MLNLRTKFGRQGRQPLLRQDFKIPEEEKHGK